VLTFDNIGKAMLSVFQILTNDNWALTMYNLMYVDFPVLAPLYLCIVVVFGSFFIMNIILAVLLDSFIRVQQEEMRHKLIVDNFSNEKQLHEQEEALNAKILNATMQKDKAEASLKDHIIKTSDNRIPKPPN
jgi:hypothetical protein